MKKILAVAFLNFKQATREKLFWGVVFFFIFFLIFSLLLGELSIGERQKVLRNAGLVGIELTALILVIFSFIFSFYREKEGHILEIYLSNFSRLAYITGKFLGYLFILGFYLILSGLGYIFLLFLSDAFLWQTIVGLYPLFLKLSIIVSFSLIFCCLFSSPLIALLSSLFLYLGCEMAHPALQIIMLGENRLRIGLFRFLYLLLPNMERLDIKSMVVWGRLPPLNFFFLTSIYAFIYILFLWMITRFIFLRREY